MSQLEPTAANINHDKLKVDQYRDGYRGGDPLPTHTITQTKHIVKMLTEATAIAARVNGCSDLFLEWDGRTYSRLQLLERAANLAQHAGQELLDESFTAQGFRTIV